MTETPPNRRTSGPYRLWHSCLLIGIVTAAIATTIGYSQWMGRHIAVKYTSLIDASMMIRYNAAMSRLQLEKALTGDSREHIDAAWQNMDEAIWYASAMLRGDHNYEGTFIALNDRTMRKDACTILSNLQQLKLLGKRRYADANSAAAGGADGHFEEMFTSVVEKAEYMEVSLRESMDEQLTRFRLIEVSLLLAVMGLSSATIVVLRAFDRQRAADFDRIEHANVRLTEEVAQREQTQQLLQENLDHLTEARKALLNMMADSERGRRRAEHLNEQLEEARSHAEDANTAKSQFLANMSHEIRTPMNAIIGFGNLLAAEQLTDQQLEWVNAICGSGGHLLQLINDILDFSKIEAGKMEIDKTNCGLAQIVSTIESMMQPLASDKGLVFEVRKDGDLPVMIHTDESRLRQCLINLTNNAVKFTDSGYVRMHVRLEGGDEPFIRFDVEDTGVGISGEYLEKIFESFTQVDGSTSRKYGGTGLGLTITRQLAELLGGNLTVESEPDRGSLFSLTVPVGMSLANQPLHVEDGDESNDSGCTQEGERESFSGNVLVAEDVRTNQILAELLLKRLGLKVTIASDGKEALEMALAQSFDLVLMDMQMPNMNGYEATQALRSRGVTIPIIALTAHAMQGDEDKCLEAGCDAYLPKPISQDQLKSLLNKHLTPATASA